MTTVSRADALAQVPSGRVPWDGSQRSPGNFLLRTAGMGLSRPHRAIPGYRPGREQPP